MIVLLALFTVACGSMNRATPAEWDKTTMEADVRGKVAQAVPGKTFDIGVSVSDNRVVTLTGSVDTASERTAIGDAARSVNGVASVINNIVVR
ncbi:MAG TPA: BON domain-containing protein [Thermoanaerobaculia bacterium]|nr:BON domain-containing protein [Thermoanaerobaculia bacterium]